MRDRATDGAAPTFVAGAAGADRKQVPPERNRPTPTAAERAAAEKFGDEFDR